MIEPDVQQFVDDCDRRLAAAARRLERHALNVPRKARRRRIEFIGALTTIVFAIGGASAAAFGNGFRVGAIQLGFRSSSSSVPALTVPANATVWPGEPVTEAEAKRRLKGKVRRPKSLAEPRALFWLGEPKPGMLTAVWSPSAQLPPTFDPSVGLLFTQIVGTSSNDSANDPAIAKKTAMLSTVEEVKINANKGWWVAGPHTIQIRTSKGESVPFERRAENTLIWTVGRITYRIEGAMTKSVALRIARSVG